MASIYFYIFINLFVCAYSWTPDIKSKLYLKYDQEKLPMFFGNITDHFKILDQDENTILIGARNAVYNISLNSLIENQKQRIEWESSDAHRELCALKGKQEKDCQNYIRVFAKTSENRIKICGTNSYKPLCRYYNVFPENNDKPFELDKEIEAQGICPYNPNHNSTYIFTDKQLYSATVADFSGADPLIYRETQRTEQYDLKQLNQPAFISAVERNGYVFFFFREIAMEYMNCGKAIYSRVGRVCKNDKGGPYPSNDRWTSFLKTRLNCSVPGEYPFYFDEIQATSQIIDGLYGLNNNSLIYAVFTTPINAIGGSAVCAFSVSDILDAFSKRFKAQKYSTSNWLPIPPENVPKPRPGKCVDDSRTLPSSSMTFVKTHTLMESAVASFHGRPLLTRVSLQYRFTAITVDPQIKSLDGELYDVIFVGTDDGKVIKFVNILSPTNTTEIQTVVISEVQALPIGMQIKELTIYKKTSTLIVVGNGYIVSISLYECSKILHCHDCIALQDPYCIWDTKNHECTSINQVKLSTENFIQDININSDDDVCKNYKEHKDHINEKTPIIGQSTHGTVSSIGRVPNTNYVDYTINTGGGDVLTNSIHNSKYPDTDPISRGHLSGNGEGMDAKAFMPWIFVCLVFLVFGGAIGYFVSRHYSKNSTYNNDNRNQLNWHGSKSQSRHIIPPRDKDINLLMNTNQFSSTPCHNNKKDNLEHEFVTGKDRRHECKNSTESLEKEQPSKGTGTLQKVKKTYI